MRLLRKKNIYRLCKYTHFKYQRSQRLIFDEKTTTSLNSEDLPIK